MTRTLDGRSEGVVGRSPRVGICVILALGLLLAACAGPGRWVKSGADEAATARAYRDCQARADAAFAKDRRIDQDILATRERDWRAANTLPVQRQSMFAEAHGHAGAVLDACMRARGFTKPG